MTTKLPESCRRAYQGWAWPSTRSHDESHCYGCYIAHELGLAVMSALCAVVAEQYLCSCSYQDPCGQSR